MQIGANGEQLDGFKGFVMHNERKPQGVADKKKWGVIVNLDDSTGNGTHWVAIANNPGTDNKPFYYDSFGLPPSSALIKRYGVRQYNNTRHQATESQSCGLYCLKILQLVLNENKSADEAARYFTPDYKSLENEQRLSDLTKAI